MHPPQRLQTLVIERLHAERKPIDTGRCITRKSLRLDTCWVCFKRDLSIGLDGPKFRNAVEDRRDRVGAHQRRRATAEEDAGYAAARCELREIIELVQIRGEEPVFLDPAMADVTVEIAIGTFGQAEWPMHINAE